MVGGAILFFGISQGSAYDEKLEKYEDLKRQYADLEKAEPYPTASNLSDREDSIADYEKTIDEVRELVIGFRPEKLERMTPEQFRDLRVKMEADLRQQFDAAKTELPEGCAFGFEDYTGASGSVKAGATAKLNYQLGALKWLFSRLAEEQPVSVDNIRRVALPEEKGQVAAVEEPRGRRGRSSGRSGQAGAADAVAGRAYELMPVELSFTASEASVRDFLMSMVNSKEYFYSIRGVRIRNEKQSPPNQSDASFPVNEAPVEEDMAEFGSFIDAGDDELGDAGEELEGGVVEEQPKAPAKPAIPAGELILKQVLGNENLRVHLCFDVVLIEKKSEEDPQKPGKRNAAR